MKFSKLIKNKKGVVLETAVIFMLLIFTFCFMLSTLTAIGHNRVRIENIKLDNDRNLDLIAEDYLAYIELISLNLPDEIPPSVTLPAETSAQESTEATTTVPSETQKIPDEPYDGDVHPLDLNVSVDILPYAPLVSLLENTEESTVSETQRSTETTHTETDFYSKFNFDWFCNESGLKKAEYNGLDCVSIELPSDDTNVRSVLFALRVNNQDGVCVLDMQVRKYVMKIGENIIKGTEILYIKKYPQNNSQPEGN